MASSPSGSFRYNFSVFFAGASVLFVELAGARLLAPVYGSSLYVWSALIAVTLLSIAGGAWGGGWLADRWPAQRPLAILWMGASITLGAAVPLREMAFSLTDWMDLRLGVFISAVILFFPSLAFLSAIPPLCVKLSMPNRENLGRVVGRISALGTAGSCAGALGTGFFLVPHFSLSRLFLGLSLALAAYGAGLLWKDTGKTTPALFLLVWSGFLSVFAPPRSMTWWGMNQFPVLSLETRQSLYGQVQMVEIPGERYLFIDGNCQGGILLPSGTSFSEYQQAMETLGLAAVPKARKALVVGLGEGVLPSLLLKDGLGVEVVEINPQVVEICEKWFNPGLPRESVHLGDGRRFLRKYPGKFNLVCLDAFDGEDIPTNLTTREAFQDIRNRLSDDGALVLNYVGFFEPPSSRVLSTLAATLKSVFASVEIFSLNERGKLGNFLVLAWVKDHSWNPQEPENVSKYLGRQFNPGEPYAFLFTDDYCPLEWLDRDVRFQWRKYENNTVIRVSSFGT